MFSVCDTFFPLQTNPPGSHLDINKLQQTGKEGLTLDFYRFRIYFRSKENAIACRLVKQSFYKDASKTVSSAIGSYSSEV